MSNEKQHAIAHNNKERVHMCAHTLNCLFFVSSSIFLCVLYIVIIVVCVCVYVLLCRSKTKGERSRAQDTDRVNVYYTHPHPHKIHIVHYYRGKNMIFLIVI